MGIVNLNVPDCLEGSGMLKGSDSEMTGFSSTCNDDDEESMLEVSEAAKS